MRASPPESSGHHAAPWRLLVQLVFSARFLLFTISTVLAVWIRFTFRGFVSDDYSIFLEPWYLTLRAQGFAAFHNGFSNYTPLYLYLLYFISNSLRYLLPLYAIKFLSIAGDFVCAWLVQQIIVVRYGANSLLSWIGYAAVLLLPTVILNGSAWAQSDSIFTAAILLSFLFILRHRWTLAFIAYGIALSLKLQSIFFLPFLVLLGLRGFYSWKYWIWIPLPYLIFMIPSWIAGRPLTELLTIYFSQVDMYQLLTLNAPNLYAWISPNAYALWYPLGLCVGGMAALAYLLIGWKSKIPLTPPLLLQAAFLSLLLVPFVLPKMHERYFFPAEIFSIALAIYYPRLFFVPILLCGATWVSYLPFLYHMAWIPMPIVAVFVFGALISISAFWMLSLFPQSAKSSRKTPAAHPTD
jgi:Gpi18-like mannosyltransferase